MLILHSANRTERLLQHLIGVLETALPDPRQPPVFLIQGRGMERWLQQRLSDHFGIWAGGEFLFPQSFFAALAQSLDITLQDERFSREQIVWHLFELLETVAVPGVDPARTPQALRQRFQVAGTLAQLFDDYQIMRPDWLAQWQQDKAVLTHPHEPWQRQLWQRLHARLEGHRGQLWQVLIERLQQSPPAVLPKQVMVFGINFMPPFMLAVLEALAQSVEVHVFILSPTRAYWADLESRRQWRRTLTGGDEPTAVEGDEATVASPAPRHHPLLQALGQQGARFQQLLLERVTPVLDLAGFECARPGSALNRLQRLQRALCEDRWPPAPDVPDAPDDSIQFHACHTPLRELEVARSRIQALLHAHPDWTLNDIVVMAPDIRPYQPFIETVFADWPHHVADRGIGGENPLVEALAHWLEVVQGGFEWDAVVALLERPVIHEGFGLTEADVETLTSWILDGGARVGLARRRWDDNSWQAALDRLLLGMMQADDTVWGDTLAVGRAEGGQARLLAALSDFVQTLAQWARWHDEGEQMTAPEWHRRLHQWLARWLEQPAWQEAALNLQTLLSALETVPVAMPFPLSVLDEWLASLRQSPGQGGGFLAGGLTFCTLLPMRAVPFRAVVLIGMQEGAWPRQDLQQPFDLMRVQPRLGDRSLRMEDRQTFLDALLSARSHLILIWQGLTPDENRPLPPAQVVAELMDVLQAEGASVEVVEHPSRPFDRRYFQPDSGLPASLEQTDWQVVSALAPASTPARSFWTPEHALPQETLETPLSIARLAQLGEAPWRCWLSRLRIRPDLPTAPPPPRPPFSADHLAAHRLRQQLLTETEEAVYRRWRAGGQLPPGPEGTRMFRERLQEAARIRARQPAWTSPLPDRHYRVVLPEGTVEGLLRQRFREGQCVVLPGRLRLKHWIDVWLRHLMHALVRESEGAACLTVWISLSSSGAFGPMSAEAAKAQLSAWLALYRRATATPLFWAFEADEWWKALKQDVSPSVTDTAVEQVMAATRPWTPAWSARQWRERMEKDVQHLWPLLKTAFDHVVPWGEEDGA